MVHTAKDNSKIASEVKMELSFFDHKGVRFEGVDTNMWSCKDKRMWLVNSFGAWKTLKRVNQQLVYTPYASFEAACDAIVES
jgi:hypothetical protein